MPPTYTPLIRRYTYTPDSTPTYLVEVGHNAWFIPMDTAHTSQTPVQGYCITGAPNLQRVLQDAYSHQTSVATPATLLADAFDIPSDTFGIPMDQSPLLTPVDMEGMSVNIPVDAFGIPEDVPLNSLDMDVDAFSIPAEQLTLVPAADVPCHSLDALHPLVDHDQTPVTHIYEDDVFTMNNIHMPLSSPMHVHQPVTPVGLLYEKDAFAIPPSQAPSPPLRPTSLVFGDDAFVIPACIAITSVIPVAVNDIGGVPVPINYIHSMPEGLALDADPFSIPDSAPAASQLQAFDANAFNMQCVPAAALPTEPHDTPSNPVSPTVSQSGEYLHILLVMSPLHIFRDAAHDTVGE